MLSSLPPTLFYLLSSALLLLPSTQVTALAFSTPEQFGYYDTRIFGRQAATSTNLQTFTGNLANQAAPPITNSGNSKRPFQVGTDTFTDFKTAASRSCDDQFNNCQKAANAQGNKGDVKVSDCEQQKTQCNSAQESATVTSFQSQTTNIGPDPAFPDFDLICEL